MTGANPGRVSAVSSPAMSEAVYSGLTVIPSDLSHLKSERSAKHNHLLLFRLDLPVSESFLS